MLRFVFDTNILMLHVSGVEKIALAPFAFAVSTLTVYELLRYPGLSDVETEAIEEILNGCFHVAPGDRIARRASAIARTKPKRNLIDLLIAATALELEVPLVTKNLKDFRRIPGLKVQTAP